MLTITVPTKVPYDVQIGSGLLDGVGAKIQVLERTKDPLELELMKKIRGVFDPEGILNPGRVVRYPGDVWQNPKEAWD